MLGALLVVLCCSLVAVVLSAVALSKNNQSPNINVRASLVKELTLLPLKISNGEKVVMNKNT